MLKKCPSDKIKVKKMLSFVFRELQLITVLLFIRGSHMSRSTKLVSLKVCVEFSIFDSVSFLLNFSFLFSKKHGSLKRHNSFQN